MPFSAAPNLPAFVSLISKPFETPNREVQGLMVRTGAVRQSRLQVAISGASIVISWPASLVGFTVRVTSGLSAPVLNAISNSPAVGNGQNTMIAPISGLAQCYVLGRWVFARTRSAGRVSEASEFAQSFCMAASITANNWPMLASVSSPMFEIRKVVPLIFP